MQEKIKIGVIVGTTRPQRFSEKAANWISELAQKAEGAEVELLDLRDYLMPFFNEDHSLGSKPGVYTNDIARGWAARVQEQDAFIIVTAEYNHGYPAVLKNALDYAYQEWNNKPVGFVSYGTMGGVRSVEQLRGVAVELRMAPIRDSVHIVAPWNLQDEQGNFKSEPFDAAGTTLIEQLLRWARALKSARGKSH
jgi:NAD(P)H-dependent FMN reductase